MKAKQNTLVTYRLVRTVEVSSIVASSEVTFRVETFRNSARPQLFRVRLFRYESFRIQSSFPQSGGLPEHAPSDELLLKEFEGFFPTYCDAREGKSAAFVEEFTLERSEERRVGKECRL